MKISNVYFTSFMILIMAVTGCSSKASTTTIASQNSNEISESLALGETSSTAYRGDRGKIAYDHATDSNRVQTAQAKKFYKVGVTAEGHISEIEEVAKSDLTALGVEDTSNKVTELDASDTHYPSSNAVKKVADALDDKIDENKEDIEEVGNILYGKEELESTNNQVSFTGNENLELDVTEIDGKTEQDSTQGYNLAENNLTSKTISGLTITVNEDKSIKINGTANALVQLNLLNNTTDGSEADTRTLQAGTYTLTGCPQDSNSGTFFKLDIIRPGAPLLTDTGEGVTSTFSIAQDYTLIRIVIYSGTVCNNLVFKPMLNTGTTAQQYEPYTGGIASPNPDYKQDIKVVTGNQEAILRGKNRLNISRENISIGGATSTIDYDDEGYITITNNNSSASYINIPIATEEIQVGEQYTLKVEWGTSELTYIYLQNSNDDYSKYVYTTTTTTATNTTISNFLKVLVLVNANKTIKIRLQVEEGSTATAYEPYYKITKPISLGNIELVQIGNYKDTIEYDIENDKVYKNKAINKKIIDGTEGWQNSGITSVAYTNIITDYATSNNIPYCTHLKGENNCNGAGGMQDYGDNSIAFMQVSGSITPRVYIKKTGITTLQLRTLLAEIKPILYYALETEVKEEITGTLAEQIKALYKLQQITGTNIVEIVSTEGNLNPEFKIEYETDTISYIKDNFVKFTDYASTDKAGVIKTNAYSIYIGSDGKLRCNGRTYTEYQSLSNVDFISKGTLDNVLTAVIGDIDTMLDQMNREVV